MVWSETFLWREPGGQREKMKPMWSSGVRLGRSADSGEHLIGTKDGVVRVRAVRRSPAERRHHQDDMDKSIGLP